MAPRGFGSRPFAAAQLKQLADAARRKPAPRATQRAEAPEAPHQRGAAPLPPDSGRVPAPERAENVVVNAPPTPAFYVSERSGVLRGFRVQLPARERRRISGMPEATLDLHGYDSERAHRALAAFITRERGRGHDRLLIIVGKGRHTLGGQGVLRGAISEWLSSAPLARHVLGFVSAPARLGGSGSVLVLLAQQPRSSK